MLSIRNLSKRYEQGGSLALEDINLDIESGAFVALLGQNGAGKTTLLNILTGLVPPDTGTIRLDGETLIGNRRLKSRLGIVPQEMVTDFLFTVEEVLSLYAGFYGVRPDKPYITYLLERLSLTEKKRQRIQTLSGGMKRRLLIARALVHKPDILLLDEPTAGVEYWAASGDVRFFAGAPCERYDHHIDDALPRRSGGPLLPHPHAQRRFPHRRQGHRRLPEAHRR